MQILSPGLPSSTATDGYCRYMLHVHAVTRVIDTGYLYQWRDMAHGTWQQHGGYDSAVYSMPSYVISETCIGGCVFGLRI